jgi:hypothetical protein
VWFFFWGGEILQLGGFFFSESEKKRGEVL